MKMRTLALVALTSVVLSATSSAQELGIRVGDKAPGGVLETLDGKKVDIGTYIGKQPVVIQFWATWCGNCKALEPQLKTAVKKYRGKVSIVGVAVSYNQSPERVKLFAKKHGLTHTILYDRTGDVSEAYEAPATSYVVVIDRAGTVVYTGLGAKQDLEKAIRKAL
jgi:thiol-disulfide isomerase/thioredoxin